MVGTNRSAIFALVNEKFFESDTPNSYEKRIKPLVQAMQDADAISYLFNHLPSDLEMRVRIANPATINAFFTELRNKWHESTGKRIQASTPVSFTTQSQKDLLNERLKAIAFMKRLAGDLQYTGLASDVDTLDHFIYDDLGKRLERKPTHVRGSPFAKPQARNTNATKKAVRKVVQKTPVKQIVRLCSVCRKAGYTKLNCPEANSPGVKHTKKVNYVYQDEVEVPENTEEEYIEYIVEEEDEAEEEGKENEDDDVEYVEYVDDNKSALNDSGRNCYATKKKWSEVKYL